MIERCGAPLTWMLPRPSVSRSAALTSSSSAAASIITPRASRAAAITALPTRCVPREANEPMQCGPVSESAVSTNTSSTGTPSVSAQICRVTDFMPWPRSIDDSDDRELAGRIGVHDRLARIAAEIHADGIVDRRHAASAMLGHLSASWPNTDENRVAPCAGAAAAAAARRREARRPAAGS